MIERGKFNDIHKTAKIGQTTEISGWTFVGKFAEIGESCTIANFVEINNDCVIGNNTKIQVFVVLNSGTKVGNDCLIAGHVGTVDEKYPTEKTDEIERTPCEIGNNVRIGEGAKLICVKIGDNSVVGAGALVLKDVPPNTVVAGTPAKSIMTRKEYDKKSAEYQQSLLKVKLNSVIHCQPCNEKCIGKNESETNCLCSCHVKSGEDIGY